MPFKCVSVTIQSNISR